MTAAPIDPDKSFGYWIGRLMDLEDFDETGGETLAKAIKALSALGETFIPRLINAMTHDYLSLHLAVERVLVGLGPETARWLTEPLEHHPSVAVRVTLAHILWEWFANEADDHRVLQTVGQVVIWYRPYSPEHVPELCKALKEAIPSLIKALKDEDWDVRLWATRALSRAGINASAAAPVLLEFLREAEAKDKAEDYVPSILGALVNTGCKNPDLISLFVEMLRSSSPDTRKEAAAAFIEIGPSGKAADPALSELLADETIRDLAQRALNAIARKPRLGNCDTDGDHGI